MHSDELRTKLQEKMGMNIREWSQANGLDPSVVRSALSRWRLRTTGRPGGANLIILLKLSQDIQEPVSKTVADLVIKDTNHVTN